MGEADYWRAWLEVTGLPNWFVGILSGWLAKLFSTGENRFAGKVFNWARGAKARIHPSLGNENFGDSRLIIHTIQIIDFVHVIDGRIRSGTSVVQFHADLTLKARPDC